MTIRIPKNQGFSLVEIIAVLIIMGLIAAVVISRLTDNSSDLIAQTEVVKSHLRYAQSRAMNSDVIWGIVSTGPSYWLFRDGNTANRVTLPGEDSDTVNLSAKGISLEAFTLSFDSWGIPHTDAAASDGQELAAAGPESQLTISAGGMSRSITITPNTGFIP
jgi:prepilin-type N-terminal cleavage/methylation domain-containing protein